MENAWPGTMIPGEKGESSAVGSEYAGAEGSNNVEGGTDSNYIYGSQAGHNGTGTGEGY